MAQDLQVLQTPESLEILRITGTGFAGIDRTNLRCLCAQSNIFYLGDLSRARTTHLVVNTNPRSGTGVPPVPSEKRRRAAEWSIPIVSLDWLLDSIQAGAPLREDRYLVDGYQATLAVKDLHKSGPRATASTAPAPAELTMQALAHSKEVHTPLEPIENTLEAHMRRLKVSEGAIEMWSMDSPHLEQGPPPFNPGTQPSDSLHSQRTMTPLLGPMAVCYRPPSPTSPALESIDTAAAVFSNPSGNGAPASSPVLEEEEASCAQSPESETPLNLTGGLRYANPVVTPDTAFPAQGQRNMVVQGPFLQTTDESLGCVSALKEPICGAFDWGGPSESGDSVGTCPDDPAPAVEVQSAVHAELMEPHQPEDAWWLTPGSDNGQDCGTSPPQPPHDEAGTGATCGMDDLAYHRHYESHDSPKNESIPQPMFEPPSGCLPPPSFEAIDIDTFDGIDEELSATEGAPLVLEGSAASSATFGDAGPQVVVRPRASVALISNPSSQEDDVVPVKLLQRAPRGCTVKVQYGLKVLRAGHVRYAEEVIIPRLNLRLNVKDKGVAVMMRGAYCEDGVAGGLGPQIVLPLSFYRLLGQDWAMKYARLYTAEQARWLAEGADVEFKPPPGFDPGCELLMSTEREHVEVSRVQAAVPVRRVKAGTAMLRMKATGGGDHPPYYWRWNFDPGAGVIVGYAR